MAEKVRSTKELEYTVGREGLKLPVVEFRRVRMGLDIARYFSKLWELNDYDVSTTHGYDGMEYRPRAFNYEFTLPPTGDKPLTVLRASYEPRNRYESAMERLSGSWSANERRVQQGTESYSVLVPPTGRGPFESVVSLDYVHETGSYVGDYRPNVTVRWLGENVELYYGTMPDDSNWPADKQYEAWEATNKMRYQGVVDETIRFLS